MISNLKMFWRFGGYSNISTIDTLLDKPNVKLEDLLEESDLIQELKSHHTKLIEFLRDDNNLHALLNYVVAPGPLAVDEDELAATAERAKSPARASREERKSEEEQDKAEKKRLKYAYVACEILACETWSITEALMSNIPHLTEFWEFLRTPAPLDPLQASYFTKVNEALLEKKTEDMLEFFKSLPGIVPAILQHVDCPMVMDLLLKIISLEKSEGGSGIVDWLQAQNLIPVLLSSLAPECNSSTQTSAGDFLKAIITISANAAQNEQSCIGPNSLTRQLVSEKCISTLIDYMLRGGNPLTVGVGIVIEVIRKNNSDYDPENGHNPDAPPSNHDPIYLGTLLRHFATHVPDFMDLILSSKHTVTEGESTKVVERGKLMSAWGSPIEPLGFDRFKTCELMAELLHCSNMGLLNEAGSEDYIKRRDTERERMRASGAFQPTKHSDDSAVDISATSSKFENNSTPSAAASTEELRIANNGEEDGFEKVAVPGVSDGKDSTTSSSSVAEGGPADEPLSPGKSKQSSTNAARLDERVRRLSIEDADMTSPPNEAETTAPSADTKPRDVSPHPEDKPAPLFSRSADPSKTPTAWKPDTPSSPQTSRAHEAALSADTHVEGDSTIDYSMQSVQGPGSEQPVVGDYLKIMFVENRVVPTILSFFFRFPWNNFLHNVVYDVVQQVFNGPMERGQNKYLAFDLFESGKITEQIIEGQRRSDEAQQTKNMRLGYMGHLTLVAEEVVKFGERHPKEVLSPAVQDFVYGKPWEEYVTKTLAETRDRDNAILGGFRPENGLGPRQAVLNAVNANQGYIGSNALANAGLGGAPQGLDSIDLSNNGSATSAGYNSAGSLLSGFGSSSDDEDEDMDDAEEDEHQRTATQLSTADTGVTPENVSVASEAVVGYTLTLSQSDQPVPLIPPPPAPLNIEPSRARRRLADRLAMHKQQQEEDTAASEFGSEADDPFAALDDNDDQDTSEPFSLDEEEQDITTFGKRTNANPSGPNTSSNDHSSFSVSRGLTSLFSSHSNRPQQESEDFDGSLDTSSSDSSNSDNEPQTHPLEARRSIERRPLDIDDDEEMGEMVAPTEEANSSDEEVLSPQERERLGGAFASSEVEEPVSEFDGQQDREDEDDGEALVEIAMPSTKRRSRG